VLNVNREYWRWASLGDRRLRFCLGSAGGSGIRCTGQRLGGRPCTINFGAALLASARIDVGAVRGNQPAPSRVKLNGHPQARGATLPLAIKRGHTIHRRTFPKAVTCVGGMVATGGSVAIGNDTPTGDVWILPDDQSDARGIVEQVPPGGAVPPSGDVWLGPQERTETAERTPLCSHESREAGSSCS
jgi:hypothetical protein